MIPTPLVSIVMPAYNAEITIVESINSVLEQTYPHWELIVINDGSTDGTSRTIERYADKRIKKIDFEQNRGLTTARKFGIRESIGKYIAFLDADDIAMKERIAIQVETMEADTEIILCGSFAMGINVNGETGCILEKPHSNAQIKCGLFFGFPFCTPTIVLRSSVAKKYAEDEIDDWQKADDYILFSKMMSEGKYMNLTKSLLYYRIHETNNRITNDSNNADIVHGRMIAWRHQLSILNLTATDAVLLLHDKLCYYRNRILASDLAQADAYLQLLAQMQQNNVSVGLLDVSCLRNEVSTRVYSLLIHAGLSPWKTTALFARYRKLLLPAAQVKVLPNKLRRWLFRIKD